MFGQIATKQVFVIFFQAPIMTESFYTHIELGHVPCPEIEHSFTMTRIISFTNDRL